MTKALLNPGREKSLIRKHPWIYSGAIHSIKGSPNSGDTIEILDNAGNFLGRGAYSPDSKIRIRVWTWEENEKIDISFFEKKIDASISRRTQGMLEQPNGACRLIFAESDGIPGLIVDKYANVAVIQLLSAGVEKWRQQIADILFEKLAVDSVFERSDAKARQWEGLESRIGRICGANNNDRQIIEEHGIKFWVDVRLGQKTGFYLDQSENRNLIRVLSKNREVLDCFSYSGGFSINSLVGGATAVTAIDSSVEALNLLRDNIEINQLDEKLVEIIQADVFVALRKFRDQDRKFDVIVLDPPKFAPTRANLEKASRGYKDINLLALKLLQPGGQLLTFSCSQAINQELFQKIVAGAALDAKVDAQIVRWLHQGIDHPVALNFPESEYLKGLLIQRGD